MNRPILTLKRSDPHSHLGDSYTSLLGSENLRKWLKPRSPASWYVTELCRGRPWQILACRVRAPLSVLFARHWPGSKSFVWDSSPSASESNIGTISHRIHGAAIYGNIYHQYTPNVSIYTSTMDPMGLFRLSRLKHVLSTPGCRKL